MELRFALLADHISTGERGKVSIIGEFDRLYSPQVPFNYGPFFVIARFEASVTEGSDHTLNIVLVDQDGAEVIPKSPDLKVEFNPTGRGRPLRSNVIMNFTAVQIPAYNDYEFHFLIDGRLIGTAPLVVLPVDDLVE